jgi:UMF1 family MFS transporter
MSPSTDREKRGWYLYDWANSAFATTAIAVFLGPYLTALAKAAAGPDGLVHPLGIPVDPRSFWSYMVSISVGGQVMFLPLIGAIADYGRRKREVLAATAYIGAIANAAMFFLEGRAYLLGGALFLIANISFGASLVVYNSFLPEIAAPDERDSVSSKGWAIGYMGGGLLLALNLLLYLGGHRIGISEGMAVRISLSSSGLWWAIFTIPALLALHNRGPARDIPAGQTAVGAAFRQLAHTVADVRRHPETMLFLLAYLLYNDAIQTVLAVTSQFGSDELKIPVSLLTLAVLMAQFVGIAGAFGFSRLAAIIGAKRAIALSLIIWIGVLVCIYLAVRGTAGFFAMVAVGSVVMGGSQALSRSLYAQLVPKGREAEYFSIYEISDKGTSWLCPLLFGLALQLTGSYRVAILSLITFFAAGLLVLTRVDVARGERQVFETAA